MLGVCITVLQKSRTHRVDTHIYKHIHPERYLELAHTMTMESKNCHDLPSACQESWWCVIQSETKSSEKQRADVQGQEKMDAPVQAERANCPSAFLLCLGPQWKE